MRKVPILVEMDRDHRLEFEYILRAVMRPKAEVGEVLEGQDGEVANRILRFLRDIRRIGLADGVVVDARASRLVAVGRRRLLGVRGRTCDEKGGSQSESMAFTSTPAPVSTRPWAPKKLMSSHQSSPYSPSTGMNSPGTLELSPE